MLNQIILMGRLTKPVEKRTTPSGISVCSNTIAVERDFKNGDEKVTDFIDCVFWKHNADALEKYSGKGRMIIVKGRLEIRKWEDKEGNKRSSAEVQVDNWYFADSKKDGATQSGAYQTPKMPDFEEVSPDDGDLPF